MKQVEARRVIIWVTLTFLPPDLHCHTNQPLAQEMQLFVNPLGHRCLKVTGLTLAKEARIVGHVR